MPSFTKDSPDAKPKRTGGTVMPCGIPREAREKDKANAAKRRAKMDAAAAAESAEVDKEQEIGGEVAKDASQGAK